MSTADRHTHRTSGQVLTHAHPGGDREHQYFEHHEDGVHITCDHDQPVEWAGRTFGQLSPDEKRQAARQAGKQLEAKLRSAADAISAVMDADWAGSGYSGPAAAPDPSPLRLALRAELARRAGQMATLAELEILHLGTPRGALIAELARMRDDGEVEFTGPRYKLL